MINRLDNNIVYNPIRQHIEMSFDIIGDKLDMSNEVAQDLLRSGFDPQKSRVLIFVQTRKGTEEAVELLKLELSELNSNYAHKVDFYHAGLDGQDREEKYEDYKNGKIVILIATKAFGMGMDIKNIHFIYHLGPSSTFEDFLQEVGRAGRDPKMLEAAGYSNENPLRTKCILVKQDFEGLKDRNHKNKISWEELDKVRTTIFEYIENFRPLVPDSENSFPLPLDLLERIPAFEEIFNRDSYFRIILYWLEKLGRIKLGVFTPTHLPISVLIDQEDFSSITNSDDKLQLVKLHKSLIAFKEKHFENSKICMVGMNFFKEITDEKSIKEVYKILFKAQRVKLLRIERDIKITPTKLRNFELKNWNRYSKSPTLEAIFELSNTIMSFSKRGNQKVFLGEELDEIVTTTIESVFKEASVFWEQPNPSNSSKSIPKAEIYNNLIEDFINKRAKFSFKILNFLPKIEHKSIIEIDEHTNKAKPIQLLYNGCNFLDEWKEPLNSFKEDLVRLIRFVSDKFFNNSKEIFNIVDLMIELNIEEKGEDYFQKLIFISKGLGFLKGGGDLVPMGIELYIKDINEIDTSKSESNDSKIRKEFDETNKMKELRLLALECLSGRSPADFDDFIKGYFKCANQNDLLSLLEDYFGENHPNIKAFREEALNEAKKELNDDQMKVYKAPLNRNIQVIAGPGTGKTHTLTLRIARLIQEEGIKPQNILVLAYNRAVVIELKERLTKLFKSLGYSKIIKSLKVFTFHGFAKYCLGDQLDDIANFDDWIPKFVEAISNRDNSVKEKLGLINYIFVDEFQDITTERYNLLDLIRKPSKARLCVIGDPNQSIYGYDRFNAGDPMGPKSYYDNFNLLFKPIELNLGINYRSYPEILEISEKLLRLNSSKIEMPKLSAYKTPKEEVKYCNIYNTTVNKIDWKTKLKELLDYKDNSNLKYNQIAIMFRSNDEVFRAFNMLENENLQNVRIRIQGAKGNLLKTREFHYFTTIISKWSENKLSGNYLAELKEIKISLENEKTNWNSYLMNIFLCLVLEFDRDKDEVSTKEDLINFIREVGSKDDGQFGKIYENHIEQITGKQNSQEIVLTTMHKVKGLEFDAVLIPASIAKLAINVPPDLVNDFIEEERRLYYVAYSRAKKRLEVIKHHREIALDDGEPYEYSTELIRNNYGLKINEGIDKFTMYWSASKYGGNSFNNIANLVKIGDPIVLRKIQRSGFSFWEALVNNNIVAQLSKDISKSLNEFDQVNGLIVSSVYVNTYEETVVSDDKRDDGNRWSERWTETSKERGFIYLIDFSGFGKSS